METALFEELEHPQTCPHGNPLPGCEEAVSAWVSLTKIPSNQKVIIKRIHELAEYNLELMAFLEENGIIPDAKVTVQEVLSFNQTVTLEIEGKVVTLGFSSANYVFAQVPD